MGRMVDIEGKRPMSPNEEGRREGKWPVFSGSGPNDPDFDRVDLGIWSICGSRGPPRAMLGWLFQGANGQY
jgi:hypothetical protein